MNEEQDTLVFLFCVICVGVFLAGYHQHPIAVRVCAYIVRFMMCMSYWLVEYPAQWLLQRRMK